MVKDLTDEQVLEVSIIENIQRANLNVLEEAEAYFRLMDEFGYTQEKVAKKNRQKPVHHRQFATSEGASGPHQTEPSGGRNHDGTCQGPARGGICGNQLALFEQVVRQKLSVRKTEQLVNKARQEKPKQVQHLSSMEQAFLDNACTRISSQIQSPVKIRKNGEKGRIEINFTSQSEFSRLVDLLINIS